MKIELEATPELYEVPINDTFVRVRIWKGKTDSGIAIEAYILSIVPKDKSIKAIAKFVEQLPSFMRPTREINKIGSKDTD